MGIFLNCDYSLYIVSSFLGIESMMATGGHQDPDGMDQHVRRSSRERTLTAKGESLQFDTLAQNFKSNRSKLSKLVKDTEAYLSQDKISQEELNLREREITKYVGRLQDIHDQHFKFIDEVK